MNESKRKLLHSSTDTFRCESLHNYTASTFQSSNLLASKQRLQWKCKSYGEILHSLDGKISALKFGYGAEHVRARFRRKVVENWPMTVWVRRSMQIFWGQARCRPAIAEIFRFFRLFVWVSRSFVPFVLGSAASLYNYILIRLIWSKLQDFGSKQVFTSLVSLSRYRLWVMTWRFNDLRLTRQKYCIKLFFIRNIPPLLTNNYWQPHVVKRHEMLAIKLQHGTKYSESTHSDCREKRVNAHSIQSLRQFHIYLIGIFHVQFTHIFYTMVVNVDVPVAGNAWEIENDKELWRVQRASGYQWAIRLLPIAVNTA